MRNFIILLISLTISGIIHAQTISVYVYDKQTEKPIDGAVIYFDKGKTAITSDGYLKLSASDAQDITIKHISYEPLEYSLTKEKKQEIYLEARENSLEEIIVSSDALYHHPHAYTAEEELHTGTKARNASELFAYLPGISLQKRSAAAIEPSLRAFKYEQMNIKYDGGKKMVHACPNRMDPITAHVIPEEVQKVEVIKGPFNVRFGQNFGGIINMITSDKPPKTYGYKQKVDFAYESNGNNFISRTEMKFAKPKFDITLNGELREFGDYKDGSGTITPASMKTYSYSAKAGFNFGQSQRLQIDWRQKAGRDISHAGLPMDSPIDDSYLLAGDYVIYLNSAIKSITFKSYASYVDHLMTNEERPNFKFQDASTPVSSHTLGGKLEFKIMPSERLQIFTGTDADIIKRAGTKTVTVKLNPAGVPMDPLVVNQMSVWQDGLMQDFGFYAEGIYQLSNLFYLHAGARGDAVRASAKNPDEGFKEIYNGEIADVEEYTFGGHTGIEYRRKHFRSQLSYGRGARSASMTERYIYRFTIGQDSRAYIGNPYLKPEINNQLELSANFSYPNFKIGASTFYSKMDNYISAVIRTELVSAQGGCGGGAPAAPKQFWNTDAEQYGFDFYLSYTLLEYLNIGANTSYSLAYNFSLEEALAQVPPLRSNLFIRYETPKYWAKIHAFYSAEQNRYSESFNEASTPDYKILNFSAGITLFESLKIGTSVSNIFDEYYYDHLNFAFINSDELSGRIYEPGRSFNIFAKYYFNGRR